MTWLWILEGFNAGNRQDIMRVWLEVKSGISFITRAEAVMF